ADAGRHPLARLDLAAADRPLELRLRGPAPLAAAAPRGVLAVWRLRSGLPDQGAGLPVPHLAAGRPRGSTDRRLGDPRRHPAEARHLRLPSLRPAALPPC